MQNNGHICSSGRCCSHAGFCVSSSRYVKINVDSVKGIGKDYCAVPQNCQRHFGFCDSDVTPTGLNTSFDHRQLVGKVSYEKMIDRCSTPRTIALTFDDGPSDNTGQVLDILHSYGAHATFFIAGNNNGKGPIDQTEKWVKLIRRIDAEGHQVASHGWSHPHMDKIPSWERKQDMYKNERAIANIIGRYPAYMRAPYIECSVDSGCMGDMKSLGYHVVSWQVDSTDWAHENDLSAMMHAVDVAFTSTRDDGSMLFIQHDTISKSAIDLTGYILTKAAQKKWKGSYIAS